MPDKLTEMFEEWQKNAGPDAILYQAFQGGVTASAFSMRTRALNIVNATKMSNDAKNKLLSAIGALSDIPQE